MDSLKLTFFGSPQVELNGVPIRFRTRKALALLAYLAVNQQSQSRETLAALFWPEFSSDRAFANLREALRLLRQHLSDHWLDVRRQEVMVKMDSTLRIDVFEFQRHLDQTTDHAHSSNIACADCLPALFAAIDLYRDDFLRGFTLPDSPAFDEWQAFQTDLFREKLIESLTKIIHYYTSCHDFLVALDHARRWINLCPWSETAHRELMRLYVLNQQRSAALQQYQECKRILQEEFETEPEYQTTELYEAILHQHHPGINARVQSSSKLKPTEVGKSTLEDALASLSLQPGGLAPGEEVKLSEPASPPNDLPAQTTSFIGRETEIAAVKHLVSQPDVRLVTLTGAGGSGKTRLGLQVATHLLEEYADGVFFVSLSPISKSDLVAPTIMQVLGLYGIGSTSAQEVLKRYLQQKHLLLLLDNFEQILPAAPLLIDLLTAAPNVKMLVTSRTVLCVSGEHEYCVPPMNIPAANALPSFDWLAQSEAVQLFVERAKAVNRDFSLTEDNALAVAEICSRLDGLPLAIELAAARIKLLPPHDLLSRLESPLQFLVGGARDLPARQQTLRKTIEWSYNLLDTDRKTLFGRLAVFVGGWTLEAAEAICTIDENLDVLAGMESLVNHNMLAQDKTTHDLRFSMLETIREYALERLVESREANTMRQQHARFFLSLAEKAEPTLVLENVMWLNRLEHDLDNLRAVLTWATDNAIEVGLQLAGALGYFWRVRGYCHEGADWLAKTLAKSKTSGTEVDHLRAKALNQAGMMAYFQGDLPVAYSLEEESVALWRKLGDTHGLAHALRDLGVAIQGLGDLTEASSCIQESIALFRQMDDKAGLGSTLFWQGLVACAQGDYNHARLIAEESIALSRDTGVILWETGANSNLGRIAFAHGDYVVAQSFFEKSLKHHREVKNKLTIPITLNLLGDAVYMQDNYEQARAYYQESLERSQEIGTKHQISSLFMLGFVSLQQHRWQEAQTHFAELLTLPRKQNKKWTVAAGLLGLAGVAEAQEHPQQAALLLGAIGDLLGTINKSLVAKKEYDHLMPAVRSTLGEEAFAAAHAKGREMTLEQAIAYALEGQPEETEIKI